MVGSVGCAFLIFRGVQCLENTMVVIAKLTANEKYFIFCVCKRTHYYSLFNRCCVATISSLPHYTFSGCFSYFQSFSFLSFGFTSNFSIFQKINIKKNDFLEMNINFLFFTFIVCLKYSNRVKCKCGFNYVHSDVDRDGKYCILLCFLYLFMFIKHVNHFHFKI